jgi:photosynthetic reaction center M subunit
MAEYQNLFTTVQPTGPASTGISLPRGDWQRSGTPFFSHLAGRLGNAQIGPVYLGWLGIASVLLGTFAFNIIGFNMLAAVDWNPLQLIRQLFWLALDPPPPSYGLRIPPLNDGGWWLITGFMLTASLFLWWTRMYRRARQLGLGTHVAWAFAAAIWLYLVCGFFRPIMMGSWSEAVPFGIFPFTVLSCCLPCMARLFLLSVVLGASVRLNRSLIVVPHLNARRCSGVGQWGTTPRWNPSTAGLGGLLCFVHW